jgi:hypothetical protein
MTYKILSGTNIYDPRIHTVDSDIYNITSITSGKVEKETTRNKVLG